MNHNLPPKVVASRGMTLLELTIVISVLITLVSILFIGAQAWKRGSDRAACVLTLRNVQVAARSYQNLYSYNYGGRPYAINGTQDIAQHLFAKGYIERKSFEQAQGLQTCPSQGIYGRANPDIFPEAGELYMTCTLADSDAHQPTTHHDW